jgi:hypothetical protein
MRWLGFILLLLTLLVTGFSSSPPPATHAGTGVEAWGTQSHPADLDVEAYDDDDDHDDAPSSPMPQPEQSEEALLMTRPGFGTPAAGMVGSLGWDHVGLRPAPGHARGTEYPPELS